MEQEEKERKKEKEKQIEQKATWFFIGFITGGLIVFFIWFFILLS